MEIFNPRVQRKQNIKNVEIKRHELLNRAGEKYNTVCIEFDVVGKNHTWRDFLTKGEFENSNPDIKIDDLK